ncbi:MAG TPA: substrate-binding domain-containing protein [Verrucomicrobiae bacterium]|nr:substrate-binding domain-containing protein [Verrucomicrobiae bacterium]
MRKFTMIVSALLIAGVSVAHGADKKKVVIGLVAKSQSNPVFQAAFAGAKDAARELGPQYGVDVEIDWQTPPDEDAQKQAEAIEQLARGGAQGIAVSCTDANTCTPAINKAIELGSLVMCFDSDAPRSKRMCYYGTDDITCGKLVMAELARVMNDKGTIAILAGNQTGPNLQKRVQGVKEEMKNHPNIKLLPDGIFYHPEAPEQASEAVNTAQSTHPEIEGWAMIGGWALFAKNALKWAPGTVKVVSVDGLPAELGYVRSGHVAALYAQDSYGWGHKSVEILLNKIVKGENPKDVHIIDPLTKVTKDNVDAYGKNWDKWLKK